MHRLSFRTPYACKQPRFRQLVSKPLCCGCCRFCCNAHSICHSVLRAGHDVSQNHRACRDILRAWIKIFSRCRGSQWRPNGNEEAKYLHSTCVQSSRPSSSPHRLLPCVTTFIRVQRGTAYTSIRTQLAITPTSPEMDRAAEPGPRILSRVAGAPGASA